MAYRSLREFIDAADELGEVERVSGASWDLEIGCITELASVPGAPMLLFDDIEGYPRGFRVASNVLSSPRRFALAMGMPVDAPATELVRLWKDRLGTEHLLRPREAEDGPISEVVQRGSSVDVTSLPAPRWHETDGGRYIGTGDVVITRDPDTGRINLGTYRVCIQGDNVLTVWMVASKHGRKIAQKYWDRGQRCPMAVVLGPDPALFLAAVSGQPEHVSELDYAGGILGEGVEVIRSDVTGLPIPAHAEAVCDGFLLSPEEGLLPEGPFGEWPGYYAHRGNEPQMLVEQMLHRREPILYGAPPMLPTGTGHFGVSKFAVELWHHLENSGITGVQAVHGLQMSLYGVISLRQQYAGHAKQALIAAAGLRASSSVYRYYVVVDEDIDPSSTDEVLWAMATRVEPSTDIDVLRGAWTGGLDPILSPEKRRIGDHTSSRVLIDACRPYTWREDFPPVNRFSTRKRQEIGEKWSELLGPIRGGYRS